MLHGPLSRKGYDWWWHSFTGYNESTGVPRAFFIEFFTCNPALGGALPVYGQSGDGRKPSYMMVKCGAWGEDARQLHRFFGWDDVSVDDMPFGIRAGECHLDETSTCGTVMVTGSDSHPEWMCDDGSMSWNLKIRKQVAFNVGYGASSIFRALNAFDMYWHAEGMKTAFEGWVTYQGVRYIVRPDDCYGYADKNWGRDFTSPWIWLSSNNLKSLVTGKRLTDSVFDIGGGRPVVFGVALDRKLLSAFWYEGQDFEFNFSKFWTFCRTRFDCRETDTHIIWHVEQQTLTSRMVTDISCAKKDMLLVNYESPDGKKRHDRLWNGGTGSGVIRLYRRKSGRFVLIDEISAENVGCEYGVYGLNATLDRRCLSMDVSH